MNSARDETLAASPDPAAHAAAERRLTLAWAALAAVEDPEIPAVSIVDLGLIRGVDSRPDGTLEVGLSPTYVGCPATEVIRHGVLQALRDTHLMHMLVVDKQTDGTPMVRGLFSRARIERQLGVLPAMSA